MGGNELPNWEKRGSVMETQMTKSPQPNVTMLVLFNISSQMCIQLPNLKSGTDKNTSGRTKNSATPITVQLNILPVTFILRQSITSIQTSTAQ